MMDKRNHIATLIFILAGLCVQGLMAQDRPIFISSPDIHSDGSVTFRYLAPEARKVFLSAEFLKEDRPMRIDGQGVWTVTVGPVKPDIYPYFFKVDGVDVADPSNPDIFPNERLKRSLVDIPGDSALIHELRDVPHGKITYWYYYSSSLDLIRRLLIYTPPGYDLDPKETYPVLYLIHGMTDTEETWYKVGRVNLILDNLIAQGKAEPMIVVMPYANPYPALLRRDPDTKVEVMNTDLFVHEILHEIIPFIEGKFRVRDNAANRAIAGFSLGGRQTLAAGLGHPELFSQVLAYSPAIFDREFDTLFSRVYASPETLNNKLKTLWISCGKDEGLYRHVAGFNDLLDQKGIRHDAFFVPGGHTWMNCRLYLARSAQLLFK